MSNNTTNDEERIRIRDDDPFKTPQLGNLAPLLGQFTSVPVQSPGTQPDNQSINMNTIINKKLKFGETPQNVKKRKKRSKKDGKIPLIPKEILGFNMSPVLGHQAPNIRALKACQYVYFDTKRNFMFDGRTPLKDCHLYIKIILEDIKQNAPKYIGILRAIPVEYPHLTLKLLTQYVHLIRKLVSTRQKRDQIHIKFNDLSVKHRKLQMRTNNMDNNNKALLSNENNYHLHVEKLQKELKLVQEKLYAKDKSKAPEKCRVCPVLESNYKILNRDLDQYRKENTDFRQQFELEYLLKNKGVVSHYSQIIQVKLAEQRTRHNATLQNLQQNQQQFRQESEIRHKQEL